MGFHKHAFIIEDGCIYFKDEHCLHLKFAEKFFEVIFIDMIFCRTTFTHCKCDF